MMVVRYTKESSRSSLTKLTFTEANAVIENYGGTAFKYDNWAFFDFKMSQHRKVLSLCHDLDWTVYSDKNQKHIVDTHRLSEFLKSKKCPIQKPLKSQSKEELSKVIYALEQMFDKSFGSCIS
jgi:hypothetical protein